MEQKTLKHTMNLYGDILCLLNGPLQITLGGSTCVGGFSKPQCLTAVCFDCYNVITHTNG